jgi:hypothetical protein
MTSEDSPSSPPTVAPASTEKSAETTYRHPDSIDTGCLVGLGVVLLLLPVFYIAAPVTVLLIVAAVSAWGLMRVTPKRLRERFGPYRIWGAWFGLLVLIELIIGLLIKFWERF